MRVLVTGAYGYIGSRLVPRLLDDGHDVVTFGRTLRRVPDRVEHVYDGDVLDIEKYDFPKLDAVVHLAGGGGPVEAEARPIEAVRTAVIGAQRTAAYSSALGAERLVMASSCYVYPEGQDLTESSPTGPDTLYGAAKEAAEVVWPGCSLRLAHVYGPSSVQLDSVADRFVRAAAKRGHLDVYGDGSRRLEYVHVEDVCEAFARALKATGPLPQAINIGNGSTISIRQLSDFCFDHGGRTRYVYPNAESGPTRCMDSSLAEDALGWAPKIALHDGLREWIEGLR